jgi:GGDEF domain-containing protein
VNRTDADLSPAMLAGLAAVAALAAVGIVFLLPVPYSSDLVKLLVPAIAVPLLVGLVRGIRRVIAQARSDAFASVATDAATGLATVQAAKQALALDFAAAQRGRPLAIVLIRIENFGSYLGRHGRPVAEKLLREAGRVLRRHRRRMHLAARHGTGEAVFFALLSGEGVEGATVYARRVRADLMRIPGLPEPLVAIPPTHPQQRRCPPTAAVVTSASVR